MNCFLCNKEIIGCDRVEYLDFSKYTGFNDCSIKFRTVCRNCNNLIKNKSMCHNCCSLYLNAEDNIDPVTHHCYKCLKQKNINYYSYKPDVVRFTNSSNRDFCIGVELELNGAVNYKDLFQKSNNVLALFKTSLKNDSNINQFVYLKRDGSIGNYGFEMVSQPATIQIHKNKIPWNTFFKKYQLSKRNRCGLHFHVDRSYLKDNAIRMLDFFVNNNVEYISAIAGRKPNHYCYSVTVKNRLGVSSSRYEMINFGLEKTIQFRFFKSPKTYSSFMQRLEFTDAICKFFNSKSDYSLKKYINSPQREMVFCEVWKQFFKFVVQNKQLYQYLYKYCKKSEKFKSFFN